MRDDSFFFNLKGVHSNICLVLNSDMLVSTTDVPFQMNYYQIGRKSVIMNVSDLIVKGVSPQCIIISLGLPRDLKKEFFIELMNGIIDFSIKFDLDYIGGDINETKELVINPTVLGFQNSSKIIYRMGLEVGDLLISNGKFGLTGTGFDILLNKKGSLKNFPNYKKSIMSVLEPNISIIEAFNLSEKEQATASIDSSDGLLKSLKDLMLSNPNIGFEIEINEDWIDSQALMYSKQYKIPLEDLVFKAGEEFIHLFTVSSENYQMILKNVQEKGGNLFKIGKVISEEKIFLLKDGKRIELEIDGFEHFK